MIEKGKIVDNKDYATALGPANEPQLHEQLKIAGKFKGADLDGISGNTLNVASKGADGKATGKTTPVHVDGVKWSVTDPRGVKASAKWMADQIELGGGFLEFEIWSWSGKSMMVDATNVAILQPEALDQFLGPMPEDFKPPPKPGKVPSTP